MNKDFEYYRVDSTNDSTIPLLSSDAGNPRYLYKDFPIEKPELMLFKFGKPIPKKPKMADYLSSPDPVISKKIFDVLVPLKIEGIQLLPARIRGKEEKIFTDYWAIHIYHRLKCIDTKFSDCKIDDSGLEHVKKLVLNKKILDDVPLNKRLVFRLKEDYAYELFHASIVDAIMAVKPEGIRFVNIEQWNEGSFFNE
jgi:hypothetical protein